MRDDSKLPDGDEFFVAYLPMPMRLGRTLRRIVFALAAIVMMLAVTVAVAQRNPGRGTWEADGTTAFAGVYHAAPYSTLTVDGHPMLLVGDGKRGISGFFSNLRDGETVRLIGHRIERDGLAVLEIDEDGPTPTQIPTTQSATPADSAPQPVVLRGEIVDSKCYGGVMKPGDGKTHKACAALCIRGGVPPTFVPYPSQDNSRLFDGGGCVVVDEDGNTLAGAALENVLPFVGDAVEIRGTLVRRQGQWILKVAPDAVRRL